jgi:hypothetical protein
VYAAKTGAACNEPWLQVGPDAWLCGDEIERSRLLYLAPNRPLSKSETGLPLPYFFVKDDGVPTYAHLSDVDSGMPNTGLEPGFAVAISQRASSSSGVEFGLTTKRVWVEMNELRPAAPSPLVGTALAEERRIAFTYRDDTALYAAPRRGRAMERLPRHRTLEVLDEVGSFLRVAGERFVHRSDVRRPSEAPPPPALLPGERWIDVDIENQVLTLFEGATPIFRTLVSTGRGREGSEQATPKGLHRVWVKLLTSDMSNLEDGDAGRYYAIQDVPWVLYFRGGYGLHGAFWHDSFGNVRSHGCVNLAPRDAARVFEWARPGLPSGWTAVLPTAHDPGTVVRVR